KKRRIADRIKKARTLLIDEVSMLSGEVLAAVAEVCEHVRRSKDPFGGLQVVLVGDFFQLPPVLRRQEVPGPEAESQDEEDRSPFAYASRAWRNLNPSVCYLTEQHRQSDSEFSSLLDAIRSERCGNLHLEILGTRGARPETAPRGLT